MTHEYRPQNQYRDWDEKLTFLYTRSKATTITIIVMAARQLAGRRPLYFTADVSIFLLFFVA